MDEPVLICQEERRRQAVRDKPLSGIDYIEVEAIGATTSPQAALYIHFFGPNPERIEAVNIRIQGGRRVKNIEVTKVDKFEDGRLKVFVDRWGDFSTYTLCLVEVVDGKPTDHPLGGLDPRYAKANFSFDVGCPSDLDCKREAVCPPKELLEPEIDYLAKDFASFRQLILDRLRLIMPGWDESHVPDIGVAIMEVLAYIGDQLSYYQDAVATEAYLDTARHRISVRRHVRLVDYLMHEGCNSRTWVCVETETDLKLRPLDFYFITGDDESLLDGGVVLRHEELQKISSNEYDVFEAINTKPEQPIQLYQSHNEIHFYTWGDRECCLPRGSTKATIKDEWILEKVEEMAISKEQRQECDKTEEARPKEPKRLLDLNVGDVLILEERLGAKTGDPADADPEHRHAVRLIRVEIGVDELYDYEIEGWTEKELKAAYGKKRLPVPIVEIEWAAEDALSFPLCISAIGPPPECESIEVSVARGNVVLADHGMSKGPDVLTPPDAEEIFIRCKGIREPGEPLYEIEVFEPKLKFLHLTHSVPYPEPSVVSKQQARILSKLMNQVLERAKQIWRKVRDEQLLSIEDRDELIAIFGPDAIADAGLCSPHSLKDQIEAIDRLLKFEETYLARKRRRVEVLAKRASSGYVLGRDEIQELKEMFGQRLALSFDLIDQGGHVPANIALSQDPRSALPSIRLLEQASGDSIDEAQALIWSPRRDLLGSSGSDRHFVAEMNDEGRAVLRFGNGEMGQIPEPGKELKAMYRVGNGSDGNVGSETIRRIVFYNNFVGNIKRIRNPMAAQGGTDPEPLADVRLFAPGLFRKELQRAVTAEDYAHLLERDFGDKVQKAAAHLCWNGSGYEVQIAVDLHGTTEADSNLLSEMEGHLHRYRRIAHDLVVKPAVYVPLDIKMMICVKPHYLRGHVKAALLDIFSNRRLIDGRLGLFHPDNLTFGQDIHLSKLVAAAQAVPGVESVRIDEFKRYFEESNKEKEEGVLPLGPLEIARLDNDPNFPENGVLVFDMDGGL